LVVAEVVAVAVARLFSRVIGPLKISLAVAVEVVEAQDTTEAAEAGVALHLGLLVLAMLGLVEVLVLLLAEAVAARVVIPALVVAVAQAEVMAVLALVVKILIMRFFITTVLVVVLAVLQSLATPTLHG